MNGMYDFESKRAELFNRYGQRRTELERAQFMGQQRFPRRREEANRQFGREFPRFTGQYARRLGSGIQSGVFRQNLGRQVQDFNRLLQDLDVEAGQFQSQAQMDLTALEAARQRELDALMADYAQSRVSYNPFTNI